MHLVELNKEINVIFIDSLLIFNSLQKKANNVFPQNAGLFQVVENHNLDNVKRKSTLE